MWIGQPDVNERLMSREATGSTILIQWHEHATHHGVGVLACVTSRSRRTERATHHGVDVQSVRHIMGSAYERATHQWVGVCVVRDYYVKGMCISCDLNALNMQRI